MCKSTHILNTEKNIFKIWNKTHFKTIVLCAIGTSNLEIVTKNNHYDSKVWLLVQFISKLCLRNQHH